MKAKSTFRMRFITAISYSTVFDKNQLTTIKNTLRNKSEVVRFDVTDKIENLNTSVKKFKQIHFVL